MTELARLTAITKSFGGVHALQGRRFRRAGRRGARAARRERRRQVDADARPRRRDAAEQRRDPDRRRAGRSPRPARRRAPTASPSSIRSWRWRRTCRSRRTSFSANCRASSPGRPCGAAARELIRAPRLRHRSGAARRQPRGRASAGGRDRQGAVARGQDHRLRRADRGALDAGRRAAARRSSRRLRAEGVGIVYISHRLDEVLRISDRMTVMKDGQVVGTVADRGRSPSTR